LHRKPTTQGTAEALRATLESYGVEHVGPILTGSQERVDYSYAAGAYSELALTLAREKRRSQ
jgi:hypothetical protein